ncbi:pathogenesis-related protein PR-1 [Brachypodium distachyon]|uniref:pathogenesis-related protein PR-1 n=1 Tax=Brachypodium distachyon TaxID=15368 RepID=UPI0001D43A06|nr:pathogenesis-related protein PR-1 [Brachypodium distachyon]|eukprot:XP_003572884.1 pathogenesis-related protein PR-1 [Brachypodium distachyon]
MVPRRRVLLVLAAVSAVLLSVFDGADAGQRSSSSSMASQFLAAHNEARRAVRVAPLAWDESLAAYARRYAEERARTGCALVHSHGGPYAQNLFRGSGGPGGWRPEQVVAAWVVPEKAMYDARSNTCRGARGACGHYTQVVWRGTKAVGCAMAACAGGRGTYAVCAYNPPGNYVGVRPY